MNTIEVDRTKVKPVVKITGEFWAQITEGDGNFHMFDFLEREGAQVMVEPIATWVAYLMYQAKAHAKAKWPANRPYRNPEWWELKKTFRQLTLGLRKKMMGHRRRARRCGISSITAPSRTWAGLHIIWCRRQIWLRWLILSTTSSRAAAKVTLRWERMFITPCIKLCHMVLALKPFGCMPSSQSDGVQSAVINKFKDMIFLPIETSGEGEVNAHSRVQMALGEAKVKAKREFEQCLKSTGQESGADSGVHCRASRTASGLSIMCRIARGLRGPRRSSFCM